MPRPTWLILALIATSASIAIAADGVQSSETAARFFESKIRPILVARCYECHGPESKAEGSLRVDSLAGLLKGGDSGPAIKPRDAADSLLIRAINHGDAVQMPPKSKLPAAEIAALTSWVAEGAFWPDAAPSSPAAEPATPGKPERPLTAADREFWAFQPPRESPLPAVGDAAWPRNPIDHFVLAELERARLKPAPQADRRTLIRRATFDLHGLPPTPEEVQAFLADASPDAFDKVVERLLASPRYGERWGRRWLDLARYADSNGMDENMAMANAWRYRDYVVDSLNRDKPYDAFLREQLAGDLLPEQVNHEGLIATGFLVLGPKMLAEDDPVKMEMDIIDEQVDTIGRAFLGLTLGCARCHDHKFDPISTEDYYALAGIFKSTRTMENHRVVAMWMERPVVSADDLARIQRIEEQLADVGRRIGELQSVAREQMLAAHRARIADYLLAASEQLQARREATELAATLNAGLPAGSVVLEAERYDRGNVVRDETQYGAGIGVIFNAGPLPNQAEFDFELPGDGTYQLALRHAAAESRPVEISLDGRKLSDSAAGNVTGSWYPDSQSWSIVAAVPLSAGKHTIRMERNGPFPHVDKLALLPAQFAPADAADTRRALGQSAAGDLQPVLLDRWANYLDKTKDDPQHPLRLWQVWERAETNSGEPPSTMPNVFEAALVRDPRPTSRRALAERYAELICAAEAAGEPAAPKTDQLAVPPADPKLQAFRPLLTDTAGPFALAASDVERTYSPEEKRQRDELSAEQQKLKKSKDDVPRALAVLDGQATNLRVHLRGSHLTLGSEVPRRVPRVLTEANRTAVEMGQGSGRLALADWLCRPDHPLTGRVMVNRIWQGHFGQGLVRSPDNFGRLGEKPDNQPLLDWLARGFVASGWSIKAMHRLIMQSSAYQMSTAFSAEAAEIDPENRLLWRMNRRRLDAEEIRDALLATAGQLDERMGGTLLANANHTYVTSTASKNDVGYHNGRRSIYLPVIRSALYEVFQAFDFVDPSTMNGKRPTTTVAPQALFMMNSPLVREQTESLAEQLVALGADDASRVQSLYQRILNRPATTHETSRALEFLKLCQVQSTAQDGSADKAARNAWQALCRVLYSSNEFIYLE